MADTLDFNSIQARAVAGELKRKKEEAREKRASDSYDSLGAGDQQWVDEADKYMDNKNFDEGYFDKHIEQRQKKYPTVSKDKEAKKKVSARKRVLARRVMKKIRKERFDGGAFYSALFLAIFNDIFTLLSNIFTAGAANVILVFTTEPLLGIILWRSGSSKIDMKLKRIGITSVLGMVPILSAFPTHTLAIGYIKNQQDNKVRKLQRILRKLRK